MSLTIIILNSDLVVCALGDVDFFTDNQTVQLCSAHISTGIAALETDRNYGLSPLFRKLARANLPSSLSNFSRWPTVAPRCPFQVVHQPLPSSLSNFRQRSVASRCPFQVVHQPLPSRLSNFSRWPTVAPRCPFQVVHQPLPSRLSNFSRWPTVAPRCPFQVVHQPLPSRLSNFSRWPTVAPRCPFQVVHQPLPSPRLFPRCG